jgi:OHCU decarboxylase
MASSYRLPPISSVSTLPAESRAALLDVLFEPSVPLHTLSTSSLAENTFGSYDELVAAVGQQLERLLESASASDAAWLDKILAAHPRLGEKKVESALSRGEQAGLNQGSSDESDQLKALNEDYENVFPGMPIGKKGYSVVLTRELTCFLRAGLRYVYVPLRHCDCFLCSLVH